MVHLVKPFGVHAQSWMRPINRENAGTLRLWNTLLDLPFTGRVIKEGLLKNDLNALRMLLIMKGREY